jgi:hypothetical protein
MSLADELKEQEFLSLFNVNTPAFREKLAAYIVSREDQLMQDAKWLRDVLKSCDSTTYPDPRYQEEVSALGRRIGFGALMHAANYGWQQELKAKGYPPGSEFVIGTCKAIRDQAIARFDAKYGSGK